ncbi:sensor histidine kinase [Bacillus sp. S3]|uniref:sensor histidine kinase n=1 Tax=Bacillus sp. S3 TaxID=486398 RepID=UPI00167FF653|nr:sensor histidine kinase [Bacillus sp. S3]
MSKSMQDGNHFFHFISKRPSNNVSLLFLYRYISLLVTSVFYLVGPQSPFIFKVVVVVSLTVAAWIITDLQRKYLGNHAILQSTVIVETIGMTLLLIPTGGVSSPFIWYALNPVLVAASFLTPLFCWGSLTFYLGSATFIAYYLFHFDNLAGILEGKSDFYLVCFLTILLARLFSGLTKELDSKAFLLQKQQDELLQVNTILTDTNEKYQQTLEQIMSLYHLMETFASKKNSNKAAEEIIASIMKCLQGEAAFFWLTNTLLKTGYMENTTNNVGLETDLKGEWNHIRGKREPFIGRIKDDLYWMKIIRTSNNVGVLGVRVNNTNNDEQTFLLYRPFDFLAELSEIMLERIYMDQMMEQMLVIEEQNRIANEIHDSVAQRLFGIVCSLHSLKVKGSNMSTEELNSEYQFLSESAANSMKELRSAIYRLSSVKRGDKPFLIRLKKYLEEFAKLNNVKVDYQLTGDEANISDKVKQALYRIICEACGNAVRHGGANAIELRLSLLEEKTSLAIQDDGIGIHTYHNDDKREKGIGLLNMKNIVSSFDGNFTIEGIQGKGTEVKIDIPVVKMLRKQEVAG